ncbi:PKD domain-containing protein, partial [Candidatus Woesearchaeota archaeon]|nr:PKD domain-containing protein [Candidatus Woesearchaeota archaeon]
MNENKISKKLKISILLVFALIMILSANAVDFDADGFNSTIDCNDNNSLIYPNATEIPYDSIDQDCNGADLIDVDIDGFNYSIDCNDTNAQVNPNATEVPYDKIDQDCDGSDLIDVDLDGFDYLYDCDDNDESINPNQTEILYNGKDDDCNAATSDEITFYITTTKATYSIGEAAQFTIFAQNNSDVNIGMEVPGDYYSYSAQFVNQTYPIIENIPSTRRHGLYRIFGTISYGDYTQNIEKTFSVANTIDIDIDGETSIDYDETLSLEASASGGYGDWFEYKWWFGDGTTAQGFEADHNYDTTGEFTVRAQAKDIEGNAKNETFTVKVYKHYKLKILVLEKDTQGAIKDVTIQVDDTGIKTGTDGAAYFLGRKGDYEITAYKEGYNFYEIPSYSFKTNSTLKIHMKKIDKSAPQISLISNTVIISQGEAYVNFTVADSSNVNCQIYTSTDSNWWNMAAEINGISDSKVQSKKLTGLDEIEQKYKIECSDTKSNTALSDEGVLIPKSLAQQDSTAQEIKALRQTLQNTKNELENLGAKEKEVLSLLELDIKIKEAERIALNFERDSSSINEARCPGLHCNLTKEEKQERIEDLEKTTTDAINSVPKTISINRFDEFVKYPTKLEIESAIKRYFESKNKVLTKKELKKLVEQNTLLQSKMTVSTKVYDVEITDIGGQKETLLIVAKDFNIHDTDGTISSSKNYLLLEHIPKDITSKGEVNFVTQAEILSNENLFKLSIRDKGATYYLKDSLTTEELKSVNTILLNTKTQSTSVFTGLAFFGTGALKEINYFYLLIMLLVVIVLLRISFMFGLFDNLDFQRFLSKFGFGKKEYHQMMMLVNDSLDYMEGGDHQKAAMVYKEIQLKYEGLSKAVREQLYDKIINLCERLDESFMEDLIESAREDIKQDKKGHALKLYKVMEKTYSKLKENSKKVFE